MTRILRVAAVISLLFCLPLGKAFAVGYTLTVNIVGSGSVLRNPTNSSYPSGATVTLTAISNNPSWYFVNWSGDNSGTNNPMNVTMDSNKVITATFQMFNNFTLALATNGQGSITLSPTGGVYVSNTVVQATATPSAGWVFASWSGAINGNVNPSSVTMTTNKSLTGNFAQLPAFDTQPQSVSNATGTTVSFISHSVGTAPLSYQWFFGNNLLAGATNASLSLTNVQVANAGNYRVIAANAYGSATSSVVALVLTNAVVSTNALLVCDEGSLRTAIQVGGRIAAACNGTITLTNTINITTNVVLDASLVSLTISGGGLVRQFYIAPGACFTATNLTIANGCVSNSVEAQGGAIFNDYGTLKLVSSLLTGNYAKGYATNFNNSTFFAAKGGAIFNNNGTVFLLGSCISSNGALGLSLGGSGTASRWDARGGAIYSTNDVGSLTIIDCTFDRNSCGPYGGSYGGTVFGGALYEVYGSLLITNSSFISNSLYSGFGSTSGVGDPQGPAFGGAVYADTVASIDHCVFSGNVAHGGDSSRVAQGAYGGAIYNHFILTIESSTFAGNQAVAGNGTYYGIAPAEGGAIYNGAVYNGNTLTLNHCAIVTNAAKGAQGGSFGALFHAGDPGYGGGIFNAGSLSATNCTITLNSAIGGGGTVGSGVAPNGPAIGAGIYNDDSATSIIINATIASNFCISSGPGFTPVKGLTAGSDVANSNGVIQLHNTIIAYGGTNGNAYGPISDGGYNISDDGSAAFSGGSSYNYTNPRLGLLGTAPGITPTLPLLSNSPAIDFGDSSGAPNTDQRGYPRPNGDGYDIGAYEYYAFNAPVISQVSTRTNLSLTFTVYPPVVYRIQASTNLSSWTDIATNGPFPTITNVTWTTGKQAGTNRFFRLRM